MKKKADSNDDVYSFLAFEITACLKNRLHVSLSRCSESRGRVWHDDDGTPITLDVDKISYLLSEAEKVKEKQAKKQRENEKELLKSQLLKSENAISSLGYKANGFEFWKEFSVGDLFEKNTKHVIKKPSKFLDVKEQKNEEYTIANVTASAYNNGIAGYIKRKDAPDESIFQRAITIAPVAAYAGIAFFQKEPFVSTGNSNMLVFKSKKLENEINDDCFAFISAELTAAFRNRLHGFSRTISLDFDRELILLPVIACSESEAVWHDDDGTPITLDVDKISYLLLKGKEKKLEEELSKVSA
jgi:hypothetical protein